MLYECTIRVKSSTTAQNGDTYVAYCFAEKQGYSKFGKYVGNGNANGPFVYTGFKPAFIMLKELMSADHWLYVIRKRPINLSNRLALAKLRCSRKYSFSNRYIKSMVLN